MVRIPNSVAVKPAVVIHVPQGTMASTVQRRSVASKWTIRLHQYYLVSHCAFAPRLHNSSDSNKVLQAAVLGAPVARTSAHATVKFLSMWGENYVKIILALRSFFFFFSLFFFLPLDEESF